MQRLVWEKWDAHGKMVGAQKISHLGDWIQWIVSSGKVVVISYQVTLFEDDWLIVWIISKDSSMFTFWPDSSRILAMEESDRSD